LPDLAQLLILAQIPALRSRATDSALIAREEQPPAGRAWLNKIG